MNPPDMRLIERSLKGNYIYDDDDIEVTFRTSTNSEEDVFEISLSAKKKHDDVCFRASLARNPSAFKPKIELRTNFKKRA